MLNPDASEFKPVSSALSSTIPKTTTEIPKSGKPKTSAHRKKSIPTPQDKKKDNKKKPVTGAAQTSQTSVSAVVTQHIKDNSEQSSTQKREKKPQRQKQPQPQSQSATTTQSKQQPRSGQPAKQKRRSSTKPTAAAATAAATTTTTTTTTTGELNAVEQLSPTSFITIEHTIDPTYITSTQLSSKKAVVHGYDRYVAWIERSLQVYPVVTVVGMDPVLADLISVVTIVQLKLIGSYHEFATFSIDDGRPPIKSGIQIKLHRN